MRDVVSFVPLVVYFFFLSLSSGEFSISVKWILS